MRFPEALADQADKPNIVAREVVPDLDAVLQKV